MKKIARLFLLSLIGFGSAIVFTSCKFVKDPLSLDKIVRQHVVEQVLSSKLKISNQAIDLIPYQFSLNVLGNVSYEDYMHAKVDMKLTGQNSADVSTLKSAPKSLPALKLAGIVGGSVDVKGQVTAMGMTFDVNQHFDF